MSTTYKNLVRAVVPAVLLIGAALACGPTPAARAVSVAINSPGSGGSVAVGQEVMIDSTATASSGIARVELAINGIVERRDLPPSGNPVTFRVSQPWTPSSVGQVTISVVAYDVGGASSDAATITLQVVESAGVVPTAPPGATVVPGGPTETPPPPVTTEAGCTLDSQYVADVTIPDGTVLSLGATFVKTWRVKNSGTCDWDAGFQLLYVSGDQMGGPASVSLPAVPAGGQTDISVNLTAPGSYGTHKGTWRIRSDAGTLFGTNLTVVVSIPAPATETPLPTNEPTIEPTAEPTVEPTDTPLPTIFIVMTATLAPWTDQVYAQVTIPSGGTGSATANCASGVVVSGGFASDPQVFVISHFKTGNGWEAHAKNNAASSKKLTVYATCLHHVGGPSTSQVSHQVTAPGGGLGQASVECPAGSVATGGGWLVGSGTKMRMLFSKKTGNGWQVIASNSSSAGLPVKAYAVCLSGISATTEIKAKLTIISGGTTGLAEAVCGTGKMVTGGGFMAEQDLVVYNTSPAISGAHKWRTYASNSVGSDRELDGYAVCLSLP
jgi:hypothetical protein